MAEIVTPNRIVVVTDYAGLAVSIYVDEKLVWAHDAEDAIDRLIGLTREDATFDEERLQHHEAGIAAMEAYGKRLGIRIVEQESIFPPNEGRWTHAPATLDEVLALAL